MHSNDYRPAKEPIMSRTIRRFMQFSRTASTLDMRGDHETRRRRAERYAKRNRTEVKGKAVFAQDHELPQPLCHGLGDSSAGERELLRWVA